MTMDKTGTEIGNQTFTTEDVRWRIWDIDDNNIYLITERPTNTGGKNNDGKLYLYGDTGLDHGIEVLTNISSKCNSNSSYKGLIARNLNLDDIEKVVIKKNEYAFAWTMFTRENAQAEWKDKLYYDMIFGVESSSYTFWIADKVGWNDGYDRGPTFDTIVSVPPFGSLEGNSQYNAEIWYNQALYYSVSRRRDESFKGRVVSPDLLQYLTSRMI